MDDLLLLNIIKRNKGTSGGGGSGGGFEHHESNLKLTLKPLEVIKVPVDINHTSLLINTIYTKGDFTYRFRILDSMEDGFVLYEHSFTAEYSDSIFLPYKNKEGTKNIILEVMNQREEENNIDIKILGLGLTESSGGSGGSGEVVAGGRDYRGDILETQMKYDNKLDITANTTGDYFVDSLKSPENIDVLYGAIHDAPGGIIKIDKPTTLEEEMIDNG